MLIPFGEWPSADVRLSAAPGPWTGIGSGYGRLRARPVEVTASGRGQAARPRHAELWLPAATGDVAAGAATAPEPLAPVIPLSRTARGLTSRDAA